MLTGFQISLSPIQLTLLCIILNSSHIERDYVPPNYSQQAIDKANWKDVFPCAAHDDCFEVSEARSNALDGL